MRCEFPPLHIHVSCFLIADAVINVIPKFYTEMCIQSPLKLSFKIFGKIAIFKKMDEADDI